jgi:hypothetical protein
MARCYWGKAPSRFLVVLYGPIVDDALGKTYSQKAHVIPHL